MTQIKTVQDPLKLISSSNIKSVATYATNLPTTTTTTPTNTASAVVFPNTNLSYLKVVPVYKTGLGSPKFKITGYSRCLDSTNTLTYWVPQCLFEGSAVLDTTAITINGDSAFRAVTTIGKNMGDGKVYNATGVNDTAFVLVDTLGCELIKIEFGSATDTTVSANAFVGGL